MLPKIIKDAVLTVDGFGYAGRIEDVNWPKLARKVTDLFAGGTSGEVEVDMGQEKMELSFSLFEHSPEILKRYAVKGVMFRINGSAESEDGSGDYAIEVVCRGTIKELDGGSFKKGDKGSFKATATLTRFKYSANGEELIELEPLANIETVGGVDLLEARRSALKL